MRQQLLLQLVLCLIVITITSRPVFSQEIACQSAHLNIISNPQDTLVTYNKYNYLAVKLTIKSVLEKYNSPLADEAESFTKTCQKYDLNCFLLPAIAGLESTYGKFIPPGSNNPFGWGGGRIMFDNWSEAIDAVGYGLRKNYIDKGALTIYQIGPIYSESETWSQRVSLIAGSFEKTYTDNLLNLSY